MTVHKKIMLATSLFGAVAVLLGAFGAHGLRNLIDARQLAIYQTGISYQFYHTIALLGLAAWAKNDINPSVWIGRAAVCFGIGIFFFSGSLYLLALRHVWHLDNWMFIIGPITPVGGLFFVVGWVLLGMSIYLKKEYHSADSIN